MTDLKHWLVDAGERVVSSFAESIIAAVAAGALATGLNANVAHTLLIGGLTAAVTTLKAVIAGGVGGISPASLVTVKEPKKKA